MKNYKRITACLLALTMSFSICFTDREMNILSLNSPHVLSAERGFFIETNVLKKAKIVSCDFDPVDLVIPSYYDEMGVRFTINIIGEYAFAKKNTMTSVKFPEQLYQIGSHAFMGCSSLKEINLPSGTTKLDEYAFAACNSMEKVVLPSTLKTIGDNAFNMCPKIKEIQIPGSVTSLGKSAFGLCTGIEKITIQPGLSIIGDNAFSICSSLKEITIPNTVTSIGKMAVGGCLSLKSVNLPEGIKTIEELAFCSDALTSVTIPKSVKYIGRAAFIGDYVTEATILGVDTEICETAFGYDNKYNKRSGFVIKGYKGSTAEKYAVNNGFKFVALQSESDTSPVPTSIPTHTQATSSPTPEPTPTAAPTWKPTSAPPSEATRVPSYECELSIDNAEGKPGETVTVDVILNTVGIGYDTVNLKLLNDQGIKFCKIKSGLIGIEEMSTDSAVFMRQSFGDTTYKTGVLFSLAYKIPETAKPGTVYNLEWDKSGSYGFSDSIQHSNNYSCNFINGTIKVSGNSNPSAVPSAVPTVKPTVTPTVTPVTFTPAPTLKPSFTPSTEPTDIPVYECELSLVSVKGKPGETVNVNVRLNTVGVGYDTVSLKLLNDHGIEFSKIKSGLIDIETVSSYDAVFMNRTFEKTIYETGVLFSLAYKIPETAKPGTVYNLEWDKSGSYGFFDSIRNHRNYSHKFINGTVTVIGDSNPSAVPTTVPAPSAKPVVNPDITENIEKGDIDDNGIISTSDLVSLIDYIIMHTGNINYSSADLNDDNIINIKDAVELKKILMK